LEEAKHEVLHQHTSKASERGGSGPIPVPEEEEQQQLVAWAAAAAAASRGHERTDGRDGEKRHDKKYKSGQQNKERH